MPLASLVALAALASPPTELPDFQFRDYIADRPISKESPGLKGCDKDGLEVSCSTLFDRVAGVPVISIISLYDYKLSSLTLSGERSGFVPLFNAFYQKYGEPCEVETKEKQNRIGNSFKSREFAWCFRTGKLRLAEIGPRITHFSAIYVDTKNRKPSAAPKIDF